MNRLLSAGALLALTTLGLPSLAQESHKATAPKLLTPEASLNLRSISDLQFSPDGSRLAFVVTEPAKAERRARHIWIYESQSSATRQFTFSAKSEFSPRWSPDGKQLAFLSDRDEQQQVYAMRTAGGEATARHARLEIELVGGLDRIGRMVRERAVELAVDHAQLEGQPREHRRHHEPAHAVRGIADHPDRRQHVEVHERVHMGDERRQEVAPLESDLIVYYEGANNFGPTSTLKIPDKWKRERPRLSSVDWGRRDTAPTAQNAPPSTTPPAAGAR